MIRRYDYTSIKNRLTTLIQEKDDAQSWKDMWESSTGLIFIEMLASGEEHLGYYLERRVIENYINTAILQSSVYNLAAEKGYVPGRKLAAAANARLVFDVPVTEALVIPRGSVLDASNPVSTFEDYAVSVGNTEIGIGDGSSAYFSATLAKMEEGSLSILVASIEKATDDGDGNILGEDGSTVIGTVDYDTGLVSFTLMTAPSFLFPVAATYKQEIDIVVVQGQFIQEEADITENVYYFELATTFADVSEDYIRVLAEDTVSELIYTYTKATSGPARYREDDRVYFPRYSWEDKLRTYFGDGDYGRNPFQDGDKVVVEYLLTLGDAGNSASSFDTTFSEGGPETASTSDAYLGTYMVKSEALSGGEDEEGIDTVRTNAIHWYATGERAVADNDYQYFIQSVSGVSKAAVWAEEDVPLVDQPRLRNTVMFAAVDALCADVDESLQYGEADYVASTRRMTIPSSTGLVLGDKVLVVRGTWLITDIVDSTTIELGTGLLDAPVADFTSEFYHITRQSTVKSSSVISFLSPYKTLTIFVEFQPPIVIALELDVLIRVATGYVSGDVLAQVYSNLTTTFHPTYFEFNAELAKSLFWDVVTSVPGVSDATIAWVIDGVPVTDDYWETPAPDALKKIVTLSDVDVALRP